MIYLFVFIFKLPVGESGISYRHLFQTTEQCERALSKLIKTEGHTVAYCATENQRYYGGTWWTDQEKKNK